VTPGLALGVVGIGSLGRHHARVASSLPGVRVAGVHDVRPSRAQEVAREFGLEASGSLAELVDRSDALIVATPTASHREVAMEALARGKHVLVEKPLAATLAEADDLVREAERRGVVLQVGHIERFNPAVEAGLALASGARFLEAHRLSVFTARSLDIDVVLDLMIHDLQLAQAIVGRPVREVRAAGVAVLTRRIDIANARIEFEGGCVANLTASRVSQDRVRKFRIFSSARYLSLDLAAQTITAAALERAPDGRPRIAPLDLAVESEEPLRREISGFVEACRGGAPPKVSGRDGREALGLALAVREAVEEHQRRSA
jgi:predicted dehydrogenase